MIDHRRGILRISRQPMSNRIRFIVRASHQVAAAVGARLGIRVKRVGNGLRQPARIADTPGSHSSNDFRIRHFDQDDHHRGRPDHPVEGARLGDGSRKSVENEAPATVSGSASRARTRSVIRSSLTRDPFASVAGHLAAKVGSGANRRAKNLTGRDVGNRVPLGEAHRLRALARSRRTDQHDIHRAPGIRADRWGHDLVGIRTLQRHATTL